MSLLLDLAFILKANKPVIDQLPTWYGFQVIIVIILLNSTVVSAKQRIVVTSFSEVISLRHDDT